MESTNRYDRFEECLRQVRAGRSLDEVLSAYSEADQAELRPLLEAAVVASILRQWREVPSGMQNRSRARFLAAGAQARSETSRFTLPWLPRLSAGVLARVMIIALLLTGLLGSGFTSAKSIPGDTLYPVKIAVEKARLSFTNSPESRLALEQTFDQERVEESHQVLSLGRSETISFAGYLEREDDGWEVGKIHLVLSPEQSAQAAGLEKLYVEVEGQASGEHMQVSSLKVRLFEIDGLLERVETDRLTLSGVPVRVDSRTQYQTQPELGKPLRVSAVQQESGRLIAILVTDSNAPGVTVTYLPPTALPVATWTPEPAEQEDDSHSDKTHQVDDEHEEKLSINTAVPQDTAVPLETVQPQDNSSNDPHSSDSSSDSHHEDDHKDEEHKSESGNH